MWQKHYREFVLSHKAADALNRAATSHPRIHEEMDGVEWVLVRSPEMGVPVSGGLFLYVNSRATSGASMIALLYSYDEVRINVHRLTIS